MKPAPKFKAPQDAKEMLQEVEGVISLVEQRSHSHSPALIEIIHVHTPSNVSSRSFLDVVISNSLLECLGQLSEDSQPELISVVFSSQASRLSVPTDFV